MSRSISRERAAMAAVLSAMALVVLDAGIVNVALPTIAGVLGESPARSMLVVSAYQLALLVGLLPSAHIADRFGYRRLFVIGTLLFSTSAVLCALAPTLPLLVAARTLQGIGGAAIMSLGIALLRSALGHERLGTAIAWNALVVAVCSGLAPLTAALALTVVGWRWLFVIPVPIAAIALIAAQALPAVKGTTRSVDLLSILLYAAAATGLVAAAELGRATPLIALSIAAGAVASAGWLLARERSKKAPLIPFDLLAIGPFRKSVTASVFFFTGQSAGLLALPFYLQLSLDQSATATGFLIALWPLAVAATSRVANRLADRFTSGSLCAIGGMVLAAGLGSAALWPTQGTIVPLAASALICGIGFGLFQVPNNRSMFLSAPADRGAAAGGLQGTARLAGQTTGALIVTFVLATVPLTVAPRLAIGVAAAAALMAAWVSWTGMREHSDQASDLSPPAPAGGNQSMILRSTLAPFAIRRLCYGSVPVY